MLTWFHLVWCGLLWMLASPGQVPPRLAAAATLLLGAIPRVVIALAMWPAAWTRDTLGWALLIAFQSLTVLWLVFLAVMIFTKPALAAKLAVAMLVLAVAEFVEPAGQLARDASALIKGDPLAISLRTLIQLAFCFAQVFYLRSAMIRSETPPAQWSRL